MSNCKGHYYLNWRKKFKKFKMGTNRKEYRKKYYECNKEKEIEGMKSYYKNNPEYFKEYREKNRDKINKYRKENKDKINEYVKKWNDKNKDKTKEWRDNNRPNKKVYNRTYAKTEQGQFRIMLKDYKRRARIESVEHRFTKDEWKIKLERTEGFCPNCNKFIGVSKLTLDHIVPLASGRIRTYTIEDVQPLCQSCNSSKGAKVEEEFN